MAAVKAEDVKLGLPVRVVERVDGRVTRPAYNAVVMRAMGERGAVTADGKVCLSSKRHGCTFVPVDEVEPR